MIPQADDSIDLAAVAGYFDSDEFRDAVSRPEFESRCAELFRRMDAGAFLTLADAADFVGLPWEALGVIMATLTPSYLPPVPGRARLQ